jgi:protein arginine kinase activator
MTMKCDQCDKPAVVHETVIKAGVQTTVHLCNEHAMVQMHHVPASAPIAERLVAQPTGQRHQPACGGCGMTLTEFRKHNLAGCSSCFDALSPVIDQAIQRAQGGATAHCGRAPARRDDADARRAYRVRLLSDLEKAVAAERYEVAARVRNALREVDGMAGQQA